MSTSDDHSARDQMFLTALTTDHFGLQAAAFFPEMSGDVPAAGLAVMGLRRRRLLALFTAASMVSAINSVVAGVGVALWVTRLAPRPVAIGAGALVGALFAAAFLVYQDRRYRQLDQRPATAEELTGPDSVTAANVAPG